MKILLALSVLLVAGCAMPLSEGNTVTETATVQAPLEDAYAQLVTSARSCYLGGGMRVEADLFPSGRRAVVQLVHATYASGTEIFRVELTQASPSSTALAVTRRSSHTTVTSAATAWASGKQHPCPGFGLTNRTP